MCLVYSRWEILCVVRGRLNQRQGMLMHCKLYLWRFYFCQIWIFKGTWNKHDKLSFWPTFITYGWMVHWSCFMRSLVWIWTNWNTLCQKNWFTTILVIRFLVAHDIYCANFVIIFDKLQKTLVVNDMMWQCHVT